MGKPFERTVEIVNGLMRPMAQFWLDNPMPPFEDYARLYSAIINNNADNYERVAAAMCDPQRKVALFEFGLVPQPFYAFDCAPLCLEFYPSFFTRTNMNVVYEFLDAAEQAGLPSDVCSTDRFIVGAALSDELPDNAFFVTSSSPCDGTRIAYPILHKLLDCPMLYLEAPFRYDREAIRYYARQLKSELIPFLEQITKKPFDIDRLREAVIESNKAYEYLVDIHDTFTVKPAPHPGLLRIMPYGSFIQGAGHPGLTETLKLLRDDAVGRVREGRTQGPFEEKHRVLWVHVPPTYDMELFNWMEEHFGAMVVTNSLSSTAILEPIDTTSLDTMLEGIAWQGLDMTMSLMRFDTEKLIDFSLHAYDHYQCDCMIVTQHVGCNSICGARGLIRKVCRKRDIPVLFIEFDYNDDRVLPPELMRTQIEEFFTTVME
ncbi:MAG: 2-hydroxyacyl-CoA dehydratase [Candidatus Abyssobacteria bacterium SURF_17]|jgi:benzoyl-CoA reductase/2-hydroxyglutaryl-CoA dehydratase subunit BcrC/BadD/HgdB|uniref:2-hydroxyacyl-CoA dehydratase n=1 Tax=Candidatus Abyssobacteria bacterium SURF_17 TaxID=2093361 RepID=A0A419EUR5_9BACT|nr:MAG: 2-hydroxyacyl-CoA dehydratase [Candidatus Abyssubacteria bacterium SURF_17]